MHPSTAQKPPSSLTSSRDGLSPPGEQIAPAVIPSQRQVVEVLIDLIDTSSTQPRKARRDGAELAPSIRTLHDEIGTGLVELVWLRTKPNGRFELIFGERRLNGARVAGLERISAELRDDHPSPWSRAQMR